ncbi:ABC transporter permease [Ruegeria hyattellae]|uniref:ABC transporter permease n=1 Tax=Ruegeria hyattellae TaxID=3233337 RepID=UPI00355B9FF8
MSERATTIFSGALGVFLFLLIWELIGQYQLVGITWPPFTVVMEYLFDPSRRLLFQRALSATLSSMFLGYAIGAFVGLGLGVITHLFPLLRAGGDRLAAVVNSIPAIALAPLFVVLLSRGAAPPALAATGSFFVFYVAGTSGLGSALQSQVDLARVQGAGRWRRFTNIDLPMAFPTIITGMKLAMPVALIGTILGEWFGAPRGIGILIVNAMQNFQIPLLWSCVVLAATISLSLFALLTIVERAAFRRYR